MLKNYFRLFSECYLVNGKNGGAIYNLANGYIYNINQFQFKTLFLLEQNNSIKNVINKNISTKIELEEFLQDLVKADLGCFHSKEVYIEKLSTDPEWKNFLFFTPPPYLRRAFIELDNRCNNNCIFCNTDKYIRRNMCLGCTKHILKDAIINEEKIFTVLEHLKKLKCEEINFTGGDVFLDLKRTKKILEMSDKLNFKNVNIFWGGENLTNEIIDILKNSNVTLIIQKYIENDIDIENDNLIKKLKKLDLNIGFILLLKYENNYKIEKILNLINSTLNCKFVTYDFLLSDSSPIEEYMENLNIIPIVKMDEFFLKRKFNSCLKGTLSITADGHITPCPGLRNYEIGHVDKFLDIFKSNKLNDFWELSKEKIDGCKDCQFRYACNDCRYIETKLGSDLFSMSSCNSLNKI